MDSAGQVCQLLEQKKEKFLSYEGATAALLECDADSVEKYITQRGQLANEIDAIAEEIGRISDEQENGHLLFETALAQVEYDKIPPEYKPVFEVAQAVNSVAFRIVDLDKQAMERLVSLRDEAKEAIRKNQNMPKIKKYLTGLSDSQEEESFTKGKA